MSLDSDASSPTDFRDASGDDSGSSIYDGVGALPKWYQAVALMTAPSLFWFRPELVNSMASHLHLSLGTTLLWPEEYNKALHVDLALSDRVGFAVCSLVTFVLVVSFANKVRSAAPAGCFCVSSMPVLDGVVAALCLGSGVTDVRRLAAQVSWSPGSASHASFHFAFWKLYVANESAPLLIGFLWAVCRRHFSSVGNAKWLTLMFVVEGRALVMVVRQCVALAAWDGKQLHAQPVRWLLPQANDAIGASTAIAVALLVLLRAVANHTLYAKLPPAALSSGGLLRAAAASALTTFAFPAVTMMVWATSVGVYVIELIALFAGSTVAALWIPAAVVSSSLDAAAVLGLAVSAVQVVVNGSVSSDAGWGVVVPGLVVAVGLATASEVHNTLVRKLPRPVASLPTHALCAVLVGLFAFFSAREGRLGVVVTALWRPESTAALAFTAIAVTAIRGAAITRRDAARVLVSGAVLAVAGFVPQQLLRLRHSVWLDSAVAGPDQLSHAETIAALVGSIILLGIGMDLAPFLSAHATRCLGRESTDATEFDRSVGPIAKQSREASSTQ